MSFAWNQLRLVVKMLAGAGQQRERLARAYPLLAKLRKTDVPVEIRATFVSVTQDIAPSRQGARDGIDALSEAQLGAAIRTIIDMYDAVTRYQPMRRMQENEDAGANWGCVRYCADACCADAATCERRTQL